MFRFIGKNVYKNIIIHLIQIEKIINFDQKHFFHLRKNRSVI